MVEAMEGVGMDGGSPEEDIGVRGEAEESQGAVEAAKGGVSALELEVDDRVVVEPRTEDGAVELEEVAGRAAPVDQGDCVVSGKDGVDRGRRLACV